jgi:Sec-independent protein translocase protein TatA
MEFLGIGPLELMFIVLLILLVFGPKDIARMARSIGQFLNRLYRSENYKIIQKTSDELRNLPNRLAREAQLEELQKEMKDVGAIGNLNPLAPPPSPGKPFQAWTQELPPASPPPTEPPAPAQPPAPTPTGRPST